MSTEPMAAPHVCPCDTVCAVRQITNPSGLSSIAYRVGDFVSFREVLVRHLGDERELTAWRPSAAGDLAMQMFDWWAYLADVLTFYNERIANQDYLGTADLTESVSRLVSLLGYRPRPGIGATAILAAVASRPVPLVLPAGFQVGSKAAPGQSSQVFELAKAVTFAQPTSAPAPGSGGAGGGPGGAGGPGSADPPPDSHLIVNGGVLVQGSPSPLKIGDRLMLCPADPGALPSSADSIVTVTGLKPERDARGRTNTRILLTGIQSLVAAGAKVGAYRLFRPSAASHLVSVPAGAAAIVVNTLYLDSTARSLQPGQRLLLELPGAADGSNGSTVDFAIVRLNAYAEVVWYANGVAASTPPGLPGGKAVPIPLLVAELEVERAGVDVSQQFGATNPALIVRFGLVEVGTLLPTPVSSVPGPLTSLTLAQPAPLPAGSTSPALVEDAVGNGTLVSATPIGDGTTLDLGAPTGQAVAPSEDQSSAAGASQAFLSPLRVLFDLIIMSRGKTVAGELIGRGDATIAGQDFVLSQSPVTYLVDPASRSGDNYSSTVELRVDGIAWQEVPSFYGQAADATVFVTQEDQAGQTHVLIGDGINGSRVPTGASVVATYRVGSGAQVPDAGALSTILSPVPNLASVRNPAPAGGGADPDPPGKLRAYAPRSVLTFARAVSADDYAVVAAQAPGVTRAGTVWSWDPAERRAMVRVYVGDTSGAVTSARDALRAEADPNRPLVVLPAIPKVCSLQVTIGLDRRFGATEVSPAVRAALVDPDTGLFGPSRLAVGQALYRSQIERACCSVPGVLAVPNFKFTMSAKPVPLSQPGPRYEPGEGGWFSLASENLTIDSETIDG